MVDLRKRRQAGMGSCYYRLAGPVSSRWGCEVEEAGRFGQVEGGEDGLVPGGERGALGDLAVAGGEGDRVRRVELVARVAPGVAGGVLHKVVQQEGDPAELDVGADAVLAVVEDRA